MNPRHTSRTQALGQTLPVKPLSLMAVAVLALLALGTGYMHLATIDHALLGFFAAWRGPVPDGFFQTVTWLGSGYLLAPAAILLVTVLAANRHSAAAWRMGLTYFGASLTTWFLKQAIERERPTLYPALADIPPMDWSLPSGHTTHAAAFALGLWLVRCEPGCAARMPAAIALSGLVLLVGVSRLHLQVHWPSDVLAGLLVAILWAGLATALTRGAMAPGRSP